MKIRIADVIEESFVDGEGVRFAIFVQGCPHRCKGCHNPTTHDFNGGNIIEADKIIEKFKHNPLISGITLSGGEPLCQIDAITELAVAAKDLNLSVWCYTGYIYENIINETFAKNEFFNHAQINKFLNYVDVLVDGPYIESQRDLTLQFRGSRNQRLINVQDSIAHKKIIAWSLST